MKRIYILSLLAFTLAVVLSCAKQGYPSGGPKDEKPPVVLSTTPANGSLNFGEKQFSIAFDEYVNIKDAENNILVSPPMNTKPEYTTKGRSVVVKLKDTLMPNTTYLFQFKEGIVDFNEGNPLPSFEYVFSTGSSIDSMTLRGQVLDAFTLKPFSQVVTVMAYGESQLADTLGDSIVAKVQPMYATRTDKEGHFALNHLREGRYMIVALDDANKNLRYNEGEAIAFLDSLLTAEPMPAAPDTTRSAKDSIGATNDSTTTAPADSTHLSQPDTTLPASSSIAQPTKHTLLISLLKVEKQRIIKSEFSGKGHITIATQVPMSRNYTLRSLSADTATETFYHILNAKGDTLSIWLLNRDCDSAHLVLKDTSGINDTLHLKMKQMRSHGKTGISKPTSTPMRGLVSANHPYFDTMWIAFDIPIASYKAPWGSNDSASLDSAVGVFLHKDSTRTRCGIHLVPDSTLGHGLSRKAFIGFAGKSGEKYSFHIPEKLFLDIHNVTNDSLNITTQFTKSENYGNLKLNLLLADSTLLADGGQLLLQLIDEKGNMLHQKIVLQAGPVTFEHLKAGKYSFRLIADRNGDGSWTPSNYWLHQQPERVIYFDKILDLRENWDMEEKWNVKQ